MGNVRITYIAADRVGVKALTDNPRAQFSVKIEYPESELIPIADVSPGGGSYSTAEGIRRWITLPLWFLLGVGGWPIGGSR